MKLYNFCYLVFTLLFLNITYSQNRISGKVIDSETRAPLAFATIIFNNNNTLNATTDIDGKFSYSGKEEIRTLTCSYVGYINQTLTVSNKQGALLIELVFANSELEEVVITQAENPANGIMRKVIANKEINDPENIATFQYNTYNKVIYDFKSKNKNDSIEMKGLLKDGHLFIMESVTQRKYLKPGLSEEVVLATKVSGFKNPSFASLATDLQPFSFYKENIPFMNNNYLNPISKGSLNKYRFTLKDTIYQGRDTVYVISYKPLPRKNFDGLTGLLYINTNKYAVQNVTAEPYEKGKMHISIRQQYIYTKEGYWFPEQLDYVFEFTEFPSPEFGMFIQGKSYIDSVSLNLPLNKKDFSLESVWIENDAAKKDSVYWDNVRRGDLVLSETTTYRVIDSLGQEANFDGVLTFMERFMRGRIPFKFIDIDIAKTFVYNKYEGARWGLGIHTNEKLFEKISFGGFFGYGSKDYEWKYGGEVLYTFNKRKEFTLGAKYQDNLIETGNHGFTYPSFNIYNVRNIIAYQMDRVEESSLNLGFRIFRHAKLNIGLNHARVTPQYDYSFLDTDGTSYTRYNKSEVSVNLKYSYGEKIISSFNQNVSQGTKFPVLYLSYIRGIEDAASGDFNYNKVEAAIEQSFFTKSIGKTTYRIEGGYVDRPLPAGLLFTGEGSYDKDYPVIIRNSFQTVYPYEFLSDRYVNLFTSHNFGRLLFKTDWFQPQISIHNNFGWGDLSNKEAHSFINFKTKDKVFMESGLQFDNIIKLNYMNLGYLGFGAGIYYRYGEYALPETKDNGVFKFTMSFTIN